MTELAGMRSTLAEVTVTLVGFSVIFRAFTGGRADEHSDARVSLIVEMGLVVVALCFLPELLGAGGAAHSVAFRATSGVMALYWIRWLALSYQIKRGSTKTPITFGVVVTLQFVLVGVSAANAIFVGTDALYTTAVSIAIAQIGLAFSAQFRAERDSDTPAA